MGDFAFIWYKITMKFILKIFIIAYFLLPTAFYSLSQNLVQNGSFEEYYQCPYNYTQLDFAKGWFAPWGGGQVNILMLVQQIIILMYLNLVLGFNMQNMEMLIVGM